MSSLSFAASHEEVPFSIRNRLTRAPAVTTDFINTSSSNTSSNISGLIRELEAQAVSTTLPLTKSQKTFELTNKKEQYIQERNKIIDSSIKPFLPWNKAKLRDIDSEIDKIDLALYELEMEDKIKISEINEIVQYAEQRLKEQSQLLKKSLETKQTLTHRPSF